MIDKDKNKSSYLQITFPSVVPPIMKNSLAKLGSIASQHYFKNEDRSVLINMKPAMNQVINLPNNKFMTSYFKYQIPLSSVPSKKSRDTHVFKYLNSGSLISLGKLCDGGCTHIIDKN